MDMLLDHLDRKFGEMGARVRVKPPVIDRVFGRRGRFRETARPIVLNIARDGRGEYFDLALNREAAVLQVLDVRPQWRHLLLMSRSRATGEKEKFLCGHDERAWFVAAVPGRKASTVPTAMEALKPQPVRAAQAYAELPTRDRFRRANDAFLRQGEWFFVPAPDVSALAEKVLHREPIRRSGGKPHWVQDLYRDGGDTVYVCSQHPNGLLEKQYRELLKREPSAASRNWNVMRRDALVYARGAVSHADHATIYLHGWHRVLMNTENKAPAMRHVAFLD
jgi:hypothetical protein